MRTPLQVCPLSSLSPTLSPLYLPQGGPGDSWDSLAHPQCGATTLDCQGQLWPTLSYRAGLVGCVKRQEVVSMESRGVKRSLSGLSWAESLTVTSVLFPIMHLQHQVSFPGASKRMVPRWAGAFLSQERNMSVASGRVGVQLTHPSFEFGDCESGLAALVCSRGC